MNFEILLELENFHYNVVLGGFWNSVLSKWLDALSKWNLTFFKICIVTTIYNLPALTHTHTVYINTDHVYYRYINDIFYLND